MQTSELNFYERVINILKQDERFVATNGTLLRNAVYEATMKLDTNLVKMLLNNEETATRFFKDIDGAKVFNQVDFGWFINNREILANSYTRFKNKIGLVDETGELISASGKVELVFPYKDCVLEGGQTKEDQKRQEIFYNETLAPDEIDKLLYPKVLVKARKYTKDGDTPITEFKDDDNLIIKGNNLLALSSLLKRYEGRVKCIYIDPPYYFDKNKPSDTFCYNSNFKLSNWLIFMNNRLKLAKRLLTDNGTILCHISEEGVHWLKVLMTDIFGPENFVETFIWRNTDNPASLSSKSRSSVEYILCFERKIDNSHNYIGKKSENDDVPLLNAGNSIHELSFPKGSIKFNIPDGFYDANQVDRLQIMTPFNVINGVNDRDIILKAEFKWQQSTLNEEIAKGTYFIVKTQKFAIRFQRKEASFMSPEKYIDNQYLSKAIGVGSNEDANSHLSNMNLNFPYSKPESVVSFFLNAITDKGDIILDFFLGSGTTAAVAHKMNRRYIGVEQMDYIKTITVERLKKVIEGEQGGISKSVNWQGGGSFVYCELAKLNQKVIEDIEAAKDADTLIKIWEEMKKSGFISYMIDPATIDEAAEDFNALSLDDKKRFLAELLDKNLLYVNKCDIDDVEFNISEADKAFTNSFYGEK